ncbi:ABC transporter permease [Spongiactinospora sp. TRM90649]|uniref:ABC transporter permease n=1 Tax=Spongiactinospora sp. TRM90649 TaxID=3031114 RepID=UPI0023F68A9F|nr:ABC transporter permease [Spongiactinospora sp. TRM90649]MDF5757166.1 ABC transporter permease [Spongiactinospora sp. TRM90649]
MIAGPMISGPAKSGSPISGPLVRAELYKARAGLTTRVLALIAPLFCVLWAAAQIFLFGGLGPIGPAQHAEGAYAMAQQAYVFTLILGVLAMTGEYRYQTIAWTFLVTPVRGRVVTAKLAAWGLVGLGIAVVSTLATFAAGAAMLAVAGLPVITPRVPGILVGSTLVTAVYALLGVALGALIRHQVAAVSVAVVWFTYADYLLSSLLPQVGRWLPTGAARAAGGLTVQGAALLPVWAGAALFAAYVAAFAVLARLITLRRDVA